MAQNSSTTENTTPQNDEGNSRFSRRHYMRSIATVATVTAGAASIGTVAADDYETITVEGGERRVITVESGDTFENALIDCTADGAQVTISAMGTDWTVRNVGVEGRVAGNEAVMGVADTGGGTSTIENVYIGDGADDGHRSGLGIWATPDHNGHIDIDRVNVQEMGDNSFYCSAPGSGGGGTVDIRNCYSANSWVSHFRLAEGTVENCTALNDDRRDDGRGVWAWGPGPVEVVDCQLQMNGRHYAIEAGANGTGTHVEVTGTEYDTGYHGGTNENDGSTIELADDNGTDPENVLPEGCPGSAEDALSERRD